MGLDLGARWVPPLRAGHPDRNESVKRTTNSRTHGGIVGRELRAVHGDWIGDSFHQPGRGLSESHQRAGSLRRCCSPDSPFVPAILRAFVRPLLMLALRMLGGPTRTSPGIRSQLT